MSRRKQARPKSCKLEGIVEEGEEETEPAGDKSQRESLPAQESFVTAESSSTNNKVICGVGNESALDSQKVDPVLDDTDSSLTVSGASNTPVFRCETCGTAFSSLTDFMDHRNYICTAEAPAAWSTLEDKAEWSGSDSSSPFSGTGADEGLGSPLPLHLTEDQLPFSIGISETNLYGCQYCEKSFPRPSYLRVHEKVHSDQLPFKCQLCQRMFRHKRSCDRHMKLHASDRKLTCQVCDATFSRADHLKSHMQEHDTNKIYQCPVCQTSYSSMASLTVHLISHQDMESPSTGPQATTDSFPCLHCGQSFAQARHLQEHVLIHMSNIKVEKIACEICSEEFSGQEALDTHMECSHYNTHPMDVDSAMLLKCPICPLRFPDTLTLCHHLMTHTASSGTSDIEMQVMSRTKGKEAHESPPSKLDNLSASTPKQSSSSSDLPSSGATMSKTQALVCPYCLNDNFDSLEALELHMQSVHSVKSNEIYTCNYCNAPYPNLYSLHDHMNVVHRNHPGMGIKYPCSLCNNQFPSIEALAKHKSLSHSFQDNTEESGRAGGIDCAFCGQCSLTFPSARQLETHMISVHGASVDKKSIKTRGRKSVAKGSKENKSTSANKSKALRVSMVPTATAVDSPASSAQTPVAATPESITCDQCNATFHELVNFQAHMKLHIESALAKFTCKKCGQQLSSQEQLEAHLSLHYLCLATEYGCTSCMKLFSKPDELQKHLMDIHAHHLYRCALCKEIFDSKVNIQVHFAIKHSNECKLFKCTQCSNIFRSEMEWQVHVRVNHLHVAKPYRCLFCAESFTSEMELQCHLTTHSKPFRCPMCEQAFHIEYLLDQHMQTDHGEVDIKTATLHASTSPALASLVIKEEAEAQILSQLIASRSPRPSSHSSDTHKSLSPGIPQPSASPLAFAAMSSTIWKNSDAVHVCNICDSRFNQQALLAIHKTQEHGLKPAIGVNAHSPQGKTHGGSSSPAQTYLEQPKLSPRDKFLINNQTLVSVLTGETSTSINMSCTFCSQTFKNQSECDKHMKIHANSSSLKCNICDETFPSPATLAEHKLQHCKIQQGNSCFICKLALKTEEQFYNHTQEHGYQGSMLQCIVCRQTLASLVELQMHGKHHFQMRPSFYTCCVCLKTFESKENLVSKLNSSGRTYYVCKPCYHGESPLYTCPQCSDKFASRAQLEAHAATHAPSSTVTSALSTAATPGTAPQTFQCIKCQESFSTEYEIQLHVANHMLQEGTTHECKLCSKLFDSPARLQCHLIEHSFKKGAELHCGICRQVFASPAKIQAHALEHGVQGRRHACSQCNQQFFFSAELENHMLIYGHCVGHVSSDSSSSRYECRECSKMFASATALANHRKTHERRDTNVKCSLCIQTFSSVAKMQEHFLLAHTVDETESSPGKNKSRGHCCPHCKQQFASVESVQAHVKTHRTGGNKLSCPVCSKTFSQARNLTLHLRSHAGDKPYQCNVCQKRFSREENLRAHCKSHTGLSNLLICPLCDRSFILKSEITEHLKTHFAATEEKSHQIQHTLKDLEAPIETVWNNGSDSLKSPGENRKADDAKGMPEINGSQSNSSSEPKISDQPLCETSQSLQIKTELVA